MEKKAKKITENLYLHTSCPKQMNNIHLIRHELYGKIKRIKAKSIPKLILILCYHNEI